MRCTEMNNEWHYGGGAGGKTHHRAVRQSGSQTVRQAGKQIDGEILAEPAEGSAAEPVLACVPACLPSWLIFHRLAVQ